MIIVWSYSIYPDNTGVYIGIGQISNWSTAPQPTPPPGTGLRLRLLMGYGL